MYINKGKDTKLTKVNDYLLLRDRYIGLIFCMGGIKIENYAIMIIIAKMIVIISKANAAQCLILQCQYHNIFLVKSDPLMIVISD